MTSLATPERRLVSGWKSSPHPITCYLVKGKRVTGFTNAEERVVGMSAVVPFLLEERLKERGGLYSAGANWAPYVQVDGKLVTGQNPASSGPVAKELLKLLRSV
jgi:putative intracellular protease/amidase